MRQRVKINTWTDADKQAFPAWYKKFAEQHGFAKEPEGQKYDFWTHFKSGADPLVVFPKFQTDGWCFVRESLDVVAEEPVVDTKSVDTAKVGNTTAESGKATAPKKKAKK